MEAGKLANLLKETEKALFRANKQLKESNKTASEIEAILVALSQAEQASLRDAKLSKSLSEKMRQSNIVGQSRELFKQLEALKEGIEKLEALQRNVSAFVERHRNSRLYHFPDSGSATKFAKQLMESLALNEILFRPRFMGTVDLGEVSKSLGLKHGEGGLLIKPAQLKAFVALMSEKKFASNISLEAPNLKMQWQDKKTVAVEAPVEKLYSADTICDVLQGKCVEK